jgi:hypothetical protein
MTVTPPETALRARLIAALTTEFTTEGITFRNDKLHDSLGREGHIGGVYPGPASSRLGQEQMLEVTAYVQLFHKWNPEVNPKQTVEPQIIEEWAERIRRAAQQDEGAGPADSHLWWYSVSRIEYPPDPTGNISRLVATVTGQAQNPALVATTG